MNMQDSIAAARVSGPLIQGDGTTAFEFRFLADEPVFAGHFPGRPLLPGIFQLEMARLAAECVLKHRLKVREISKAKFLRPILPEELVRLALKLSDEGGTIQARASLSVEGKPAGETILMLCRND